jgi:hypothetical protein
MEYHVRSFQSVHITRLNFYVFGQFDKHRVDTASTRSLLLEGAETTSEPYELGICGSQGALQIVDLGLQSRKRTRAPSLVIIMVILTVVLDLVTKIFDFCP